MELVASSCQVLRDPHGVIASGLSLSQALGHLVAVCSGPRGSLLSPTLCGLEGVRPRLKLGEATLGLVGDFLPGRRLCGGSVALHDSLLETLGLAGIGAGRAAPGVVSKLGELELK